MKKVGIIAIIVKDKSIVMEVQKLLSEFSDIILGRMGVPDREHGIQAISVFVEGENEKLVSEISSMLVFESSKYK